MARDENDYDDDERITRSTRRSNQQTDRLPQREIPRGEPVRSDWLSSRQASRPRPRRGGTVPSSREEFVVWLERGGWRTAALVAAGTFAAIMLMIVVGNRAGNAPQPLAQPTSAAVLGGNNGAGPLPTLSLQPSVTPAAPPAAATGAKFRVINTDQQGLFLRSDHEVNTANILETLPDSTEVTIIGEDYVGSDRVWKKVRAPSGKEGWVASDFLEKVQP